MTEREKYSIAMRGAGEVYVNLCSALAARQRTVNGCKTCTNNHDPGIECRSGLQTLQEQIDLIFDLAFTRTKLTPRELTIASELISRLENLK